MSDEILSHAEVQRVWREQHREDGSLIPLSEAYPNLYKATIEPRDQPRDISLVAWFELHLAEARSGKFNAAAIEPGSGCKKHRKCHTFHFFTKDD